MAYYITNLVVSLILVLVFIYKWNSGYSVYFTVMCVIIAVSNIGYWQLYAATSLEQALLANKITYLSGCFAVLSLVMCVFYLCEINVPKYVTVLLFFISTIIFGGNLTAGYSQIFYKSASLVLMDNGRYKLIKEYGPMHKYFYIMLVAYYLICIWALMRGYRNRKKMSVYMMHLFALAITANMMAFFIGNKIMGYDLMPLAYNFSMVMFIMVSNRYALYDVDSSVVSSLLKRETLGIISFDSNFVYLGSNDVAQKIYPPVSELYVDRKMSTDEESLWELNSWIDEVKTKGHYDGYYSFDNRHYHVTSGILYSGKKAKGYQFSFTDCTELLLLSTTDKLTGLPNRRAYEDALGEVQSVLYPRGKLEKESLCICSFDINGLKAINDNSGHSAGDELIKAASTCIEKAFGSFGTIYRTGGDEFMAVIYADDKQLKLAINSLNEYTKNWQGESIKSLAVSVGIAGINEFPEDSVVELAKKADARMYQDKNDYYVRTGIERRRG